MSVYLEGLLWVLAASVFAVGLTVAIRRFGSAELREANNDAAGKVFSIVGGLSAVLIAFVLIAQFDGITSARASTAREADNLVAVYWAADSRPAAVRAQIQELCQSYAKEVADEEWPAMARGESVSARGGELLDKLHAAIASDTTTSVQAQAATDPMLELYMARQDRLERAAERVNPVVWLALIIGALISILFPHLFGGPKFAAHAIIMVTLSATMVLLLFAIYQLQNPFGGGARVTPEAFRLALDRFGSHLG
ncbi:DUF4239 domain-containing protein [Solihabitans fulvus]|uniref:DUF4239 domain-containing protein n=1 Tax=Solihabitans fulvus TaxID=1892852 RepID=A0A5B2XTT4_9PSEU|nr:DUF4239 domain-containing protein [Solihabitans fulvus]KAA2266575.1 DUF4239 domain-containing protein [Solihabitans fulvus]